jgi:peptidoglycan hydrolase-like protein with peptidoglycan-binding domain
LATVLNGAPLDTDGVFGDGTRAAVEAFQHLRGLRVDGI